MIYNLDVIETESRTIQFLNWETVIIRYKDEVVVTLDQVKEDYIVYDHLTKGHRVKKLILSGINTSMDKKARDYILKENFLRSELIIAEAIVVNSAAQKVLGNIYISFSESFYPKKLFCDEERAKLWLNEIK